MISGSQWFVSPLSMWYCYVVDDHYARASKVVFKMEMQFIFVLHCIKNVLASFLYSQNVCGVHEKSGQLEIC